MTSVGPVIARKRARAQRETAWAYLADPELRRGWWPDSELDPTLGGAVSERWSEGEGSDAAMRNAQGVVDVCIPGHALGFRWRDAGDEHETEVLFTLRSEGTATDITVTETGFGRFPDALDRIADARQGWIDLLGDYVTALAQALPAVPSPFEDEAAEPEAAEPGAAEPEAAEPEAAAAPGTAAPGTAAPEFAEPDAAQAAPAAPAEAAGAAETADGGPEGLVETGVPTGGVLVAAPQEFEAEIVDAEVSAQDAEELLEVDPEPSVGELPPGQERDPHVEQVGADQSGAEPQQPEVPTEEPELDFDALIRGDGDGTQRRQ